MKVLVAYFSETGNTEKIAEAIYDEASKEHEAHLKKVKDVTAESLIDYDLVFLGSACHSSDLAVPVKKVLNALPNLPKFKLAGFFTHSTQTPESDRSARVLFNKWASKCIVSFKKISKEKQIDFRGYFNCQGVPSPPIQEFIHREIVTADSDFEAYLEEAKKHPSSEDMQKAKEFARKVLSTLQQTQNAPDR